MPGVSWRVSALQPSTGSVAADLSLGEHVLAEAHDLVVMTQACDLEHAKVTSVVLCPHYGLDEFKDAWEADQRNKGQNPTAKAWRRCCDEICEGTIWNLNLLNAQTDVGVDVGHRIVDFHEVFTLPRPVLESLLTARNVPRPQLLAPYREHLSQSFARFFMRVGLPTPVAKTWWESATTSGLYRLDRVGIRGASIPRARRRGCRDDGLAPALRPRPSSHCPIRRARRRSGVHRWPRRVPVGPGCSPIRSGRTGPAAGRPTGPDELIPGGGPVRMPGMPLAFGRERRPSKRFVPFPKGV